MARLDVGNPFGGFFSLISTVVRVGILCLLTAIVLLVGGGYVERIRTLAAAEPLKAGAVGFLSQVLMVPALVIVAIVLVITIIGIPFLLLLPFAVLALAVLALVGFTAVARELGQLVLGRVWSENGAGVFAATIAGVLLIVSPVLLGRLISIGGGPLWLVSTPLSVVGFVVEYLAWTIGFGAVLFMMFGRRAVVYRRRCRNLAAFCRAKNPRATIYREWPPATGLLKRRAWVFSLACAALAVACVAAPDLIYGARPALVNVRWASRVGEPERRDLEARYRLTRPVFREGSTWAYYLADPSRRNVRALVTDPGVEDTHYINRLRFTIWREASRDPYRGPGARVLPGLLGVLAWLLGLSAVGFALTTVPRVARAAPAWLGRGHTVAHRLAAAWAPVGSARSVGAFRVVFGAALLAMVLHQPINEKLAVLVASSAAPVDRLGFGWVWRAFRSPAGARDVGSGGLGRGARRLHRRRVRARVVCGELLWPLAVGAPAHRPR